MTYTGGFGVDTTGIDFGDTFLPGAGSPTYGTYDFLPRSQFPEDFYNTQSNSGGGFFDQFGRFMGYATQALPGIARTVNAVKDITNPRDAPGIFNPDFQRESTEKLDKERVKTYADIQDAFKRIAGVTGVSTEDAVQQYYKQFSDTMDKITTQGRADLREDPDISKQYATLGNRITKDQAQYSNLNNLRYTGAYKAADAVDPINPNAIKDVMTLGPAYKEQYSYEDPESRQNIYGRRNAIGDIASFYANDPNLNQYMVSATDRNIQDLMNYG